MKRINTILTIILLVVAGCENSRQSTDEFITVDVTKSYPEKELILQDFLDVEYIPLETNDEFLTTGYVQAIGKEIIIVRNINQAGASIFIFDRSGKGLRKINRRGQSNEEYTFISGLILLDEDNGEMFVDCGSLRKVMVYDLFGNFKRSFKHKDNGDGSGKWQVFYGSIYSFDRDNLICEDKASGRNFFGKNSEGGLDFDVEPRNMFWIISKQDGSVIREIQIPFKRKMFTTVFAPEGVGGVSNTGLIPYRDSWILTETSSDTIYRYWPDHTMRPFIVRTPSIQSMMDPKIFLFPGVLTDRYYFLQAVKMEYDGTADPSEHLLETDLVYDRQEKRTFKYAVYNDDFTNKRPIKNLVDKILTLTVVNNDEVAFMEKIEAYELVEAYKEGKLKGKLKEIAAELDEESNPVIMLAKYKKKDNE
jgi:hypothetical protein